MEERRWWQSTTIRALAVSLVTKGLLLVGFLEEDTTALANDAVQFTLLGVDMVLNIIAARGRWRAGGPIT